MRLGLHIPDLDAKIEAFQHCIEERDVVAAERLLHPEFALVLVHPTPAIMSRARWLEVLPDYVVHEYAVEERLIWKRHSTPFDGGRMPGA